MSDVKCIDCGLTLGYHEAERRDTGTSENGKEIQSLEEDECEHDFIDLNEVVYE